MFHELPRQILHYDLIFNSLIYTSYLRWKNLHSFSKILTILFSFGILAILCSTDFVLYNLHSFRDLSFFQFVQRCRASVFQASHLLLSWYCLILLAFYCLVSCRCTHSLFVDIFNFLLFFLPSYVLTLLKLKTFKSLFNVLYNWYKRAQPAHGTARVSWAPAPRPKVYLIFYYITYWSWKRSYWKMFKASKTVLFLFSVIFHFWCYPIQRFLLSTLVLNFGYRVSKFSPRNFSVILDLAFSFCLSTSFSAFHSLLDSC